ncbi:MAG: hypothetical protein K2K15_03970 [Anaeroplasmataceae bacterium]|nr:hypothetical protein [Anaeroplasmataceae bacterium]
MVQDLILLTLIGCVLEGLCTKMLGFVLDAIPTATISLIVVFIAVARWNLWGLLTVPLLAIGTLVGGMLHIIPEVGAVYDWKIYLSVVLGLCTIGIDVIFFKKMGTKNALQKTWLMILILLLNYILFNLVHIFFYKIFAFGNPFILGDCLYTITFEDESHMMHTNTYYIDNEYIYNLFGLAILIVGSFVLRSQGVISNVVDKLVEDRENAEMLREDEETFRVEESSEAIEAEEESKPAIDSETKKD